MIRAEIARQGFTVVPAVVSERWLAPARETIVQFVGPDPVLEWGVVPLHHAPAFWAIRQLPALHRVFADLHGTDALWVSMDRAIYKAPHQPDGSALHWDVDPRIAREPAYQGMLFLTESGGAPFQCVPSVFRDLEGYLPAYPDLAGHPLLDVAAAAGDLVLWDARLPHRGSPNLGDTPRLSLAIVMNPAGSEAERAERVACWKAQRAPAQWRGWPGQADREAGPPAALTALGRRLVGLDRW